MQHQPRTTVRRSMIRFAAAAAMAVAVPLCGPALAADAWPSQPVRIVVNFPPGGAADVMARLISEPMSQALGQPVVIENRAGANGNIGGEAVAKAAADGYTFLFSSGGVASVNPHLYTGMSFDPAKDLQPVAAAARVPVFLVVRPDVPVASVAEFIEYARKNPGKLTYGTPGNGSSPHLAAEMFNGAAGIDTVHVPYRGAAPAMVDLLAGQVHYMFDPGIGVQYVRSGKLKLLAVGSPERSPLFPDAPTVAESGLAGFDADSWFGLYAPAGVDEQIVARMNAEVNRALNMPAVRDRITEMGSVPSPMSPQEFGQKAEHDFQRFGKIIEERGIKVQ